MAATQLQKLLEILSVAGIFISIIVTAVFLIFALAGAIAGSEPASVWAIVWNAFFIGLPLYGLLFAALKLREYLRDILIELKKASA
ncbi:MAG: hypothetical protein IIB67_03295 [Proteobacteria bacterium]|nr:hypothetical protein [Pseudomonadota bacterium]